ncbi:MAG: NYN domain-containing protein [Thermosynechococcaceae cyanobacterium]
MAQRWLVLAAVVTGMSFGASYVTTRSLRQAFSHSMITLASASVGVAVAEDWRRRSDPGVSPMKTASLDVVPSKQVAIFWDYENVKVPAGDASAPLAESLIEYAKSLGHLRVKIVYSNWRRKDERIVQTLYSLGFEPIHVSMGKTNSVDVKLVVDCLEAAYRDATIAEFIIVTGDKDFIPLVNALKDLKRQVTVIGRSENVSEQLLLSADEFMPLKQLLQDAADRQQIQGDAGAVNGQATLSYEEAIACLVEAIGKALEQQKSTQLSTIGKLMRDINPIYTGASSVQRPTGGVFVRFSELIQMAEREGQVRVVTTSGGFKELFLSEEDPQDESDFSPPAARQMDRQQWSLLIGEVETAFQELRPLPSFVPLLRSVTRAKTSGVLDFLSHGSLRKSLQRLIDVGILLPQEDGGFCLVEQLTEQREQFLDQLTMDAVVAEAPESQESIEQDAV